MKYNRLCILSLIIFVGSIALVGCGDKGTESVDSTLTKTTQSPPPRPNKPGVTPGGAGGPQGAKIAP